MKLSTIFHATTLVRSVNGLLIYIMINIVWILKLWDIWKIFIWDLGNNRDLSEISGSVILIIRPYNILEPHALLLTVQPIITYL